MEHEVRLMLEALEEVKFKVAAHRETIRPENLEFLQKHFPSKHLLTFLQAASFDEAVQVGEVWFEQVNCFAKEFAWEEHFTRCVAAGLLCLGNGSTGDPIVIDAHDLQIGFLFHDTLWEDDAADPRSCLVKMNCSIGQFYWNSAFVEGYPVDAYGAAAYMQVEFSD